jgi:hypothetical protein
MNQTDVRITTPDAVTPLPGEATAGVTAWQMEKIKTGSRDADAGRFASPADVRSVIQNSSPMEELLWTDTAVPIMTKRRCESAG